MNENRLLTSEVVKDCAEMDVSQLALKYHSSEKVIKSYLKKKGLRARNKKIPRYILINDEVGVAPEGSLKDAFLETLNARYDEKVREGLQLLKNELINLNKVEK